ncbi:MAG: chemotaxis protein [Desulfobacteraceae bacterium]|nr:chemotaxis protein [Desulfobacteraceae bacterium]
MQWFKSTKVSTKLVLGFSIMIVMICIIGFAGYKGVSLAQHSLDEIHSVAMPSIDYLIEADRDLQQLLVAERSMIFTDVNSDSFKQFVDDYETNLKQADTRFGKYKALATSDEEKSLIPEYEKARAEWEVLSRQVVEARKADTDQGRKQALDLTLGAAAQKFEAMRDYIDKLTEIKLAYADSEQKESAVGYRQTLIVQFTIVGIGLLTGLFLTWTIGRAVTLPLRRMIDQLKVSSNQVASASEQLSASSQTLAEGSSEQAAGIEETSSSLEEMASMAKQNSANAGQADSLMKETNAVVQQASSDMVELTGSMDEISRASEETQKIVKTIDEIAFQTNLLALNAAVEAARAGEAGAGFAVVADEVRNLAIRAAEAAKNTSDLIEGTSQKIQGGGELVGRTNKGFQAIAESASKVGDLVAEISAASNEQAQGVDQINNAVVEMDKVVQNNAATAEESASSSEEMIAQAAQMKEMVAELVAIVEGRSYVAKEQNLSKPRMRKATKTADSSSRTPVRARKSSPIAEQMIPFDDNANFSDF